MMTSMIWTLIALMAGGLVALLVDSRAGRRELRTELRTELRSEIGGLRTEMRQEIGALRERVDVLADRQAEMNGRLEMVAAMAHAHPPTIAGS